MRKVAITLKIVQIEEKSFFSNYFLREKARQFGNMTRLCILGLDNFYIPYFASKLLLKEVICKKTVKNVFFQQNQVQIAIFASKRLSCKMYNQKQCVSQQNVINKLEAEIVDLQFLFY